MSGLKEPEVESMEYVLVVAGEESGDVLGEKVVQKVL